MSPGLGFGFTIFSMLLPLAIYCGIAFVAWKFYQMIAKIGEDVAAIRRELKRRPADPDLDLDLELPPDHPLA